MGYEVKAAAAPQRERYDAIDGLRAFAALGIVFMHVLSNGGYSLPGPVQTVIGSLGEFVYLFMVISGFSMCCGYFQRFADGSIDLGRFYARRYSKILPFFALLCLVDFALSPSWSSLFETFANLTLCFGLLPNPSFSVIGVGWFLGMVFVFYLVFPFFCWLLGDKRRAWVSFLAALVYNILCQVYFFDSAHVVVGFDMRSNFLYCAVYFMAGGMLYLYRGRLVELSQKHRAVTWVLCVVAVLAFFFAGVSTATLLAVSVLLLVYAVGSKGSTVVLVNPVTRFLSGISLEIYLCHMMIFRVLEMFGVAHLMGGRGLSYVFTLALVIVAAIAFSVAARKAFSGISGLKHAHACSGGEAQS